MRFRSCVASRHSALPRPRLWQWLPIRFVVLLSDCDGVSCMLCACLTLLMTCRPPSEITLLSCSSTIIPSTPSILLLSCIQLHASNRALKLPLLLLRHVPLTHPPVRTLLHMSCQQQQRQEERLARSHHCSAVPRKLLPDLVCLGEGVSCICNSGLRLRSNIQGALDSPSRQLACLTPRHQEQRSRPKEVWKLDLHTSQDMRDDVRMIMTAELAADAMALWLQVLTDHLGMQLTPGQTVVRTIFYPGCAEDA